MEGNIKVVARLVRVGVNMGDHAQDEVTMQEVLPDETVQEMVDRLLGRSEYRAGVMVRVPDEWTTRVELQLVQPVGWQPHRSDDPPF